MLHDDRREIAEASKSNAQRAPVLRVDVARDADRAAIRAPEQISARAVAGEPREGAQVARVAPRARRIDAVRPASRSVAMLPVFGQCAVTVVPFESRTSAKKRR